MKTTIQTVMRPFHQDEGVMRLFMLFAIAMLLLVASDMSHAAVAGDAFSGSTLSEGLTNLIATLNGTVARSLAIVAVIGAGIAGLTGKMEWTRVVVVVLGVGIVFSATSVIDVLFVDVAGVK